eukprot:jgi/Mesen1/10905/ME000095S10239
MSMSSSCYFSGDSRSVGITKTDREGKAQEKLLLTNVHATASHGQVTAVVGPSGAGKSTFLDAIAGRINPKSLEGRILVNGKEIRGSFKRLSGYVQQDDSLFKMLTVRETLMFSARLRLPSSMSRAEKEQRVETLIQELGLAHCADTVIGNHEIHGVSGGERRRASIGVDLVHDPPVLFLDEPTSGLDSSAALGVAQTLRHLAEARGRTIVLTVHQPSFAIIALVHRFVVLARGCVVFHGAYLAMLEFFRSYGRAIPERVNVLEYALDLIEEEQEGPAGLAPLVAFHEDWATMQQRGGGEGTSGIGSKQLPSSLGSGQVADPEFATSFFSEVLVLSDRNFKNIFRTKELFGARIILMLVTGATMGSLFFNVGLDYKGLEERQSFFAFTLALFVFTATEGLPVFLDERQVFIRETSRGAYRASSYVVANALVFLPFLLLLALLFSGITYYLVGLVDAQPAAFFVFVATMFLCLAVANSFVVFCSSVVPNFITGNTVITATNAYFFLFSGFFIPRESIPKYWQWMHYLSTFKYPIEILEYNEYSRIHSCWSKEADGSCSITSDDVLRDLSAGKVHLWANFGVYTFFYIIYRVFFYIALLRQSKAVRK